MYRSQFTETNLNSAILIDKSSNILIFLTNQFQYRNFHSMTGPNHPLNNRIVFFDNDCGICSFSVRSLLKIDRRQTLSFAPLQGETARSLLDPKWVDRDDLSTIVYLNLDDGTYTRSSAVLAIFRDIGWPYKILTIFKVLPEAFRDSLYDSFAQRRKKLSNSLKCRLLTPEERQQFLP